MKCPKCEADTVKVLDSRDADGGSAVRRRRECEKCQHRFTTYERFERPKLIVIKKDLHKEPYSREKLAHGLWRALEKRPVSQEKVEQLLTEIDEQLTSRGESEILSNEIGELVMNLLKDVDEVAYIRFASVYRSFKDVASFQKELRQLKK